jgi:hypothetical protein
MKPFNEHNPQTAELAIGDYVLHGDVIVERVSALPTEFTTLETEPNNALAYGELTGHLHQLQGEAGVDFDLRVNPVTKERHLRIVKPVLLKHQEHSPLLLREGEYKIGIQREYDPFEKLIRQVAD